MRGDIRFRHWLVAILMAIGAQVAVLAAVFSSEPSTSKAQQAGIVLQLSAVTPPGNSLAAMPAEKTPPQPVQKPVLREVAKPTPKPRPKPKPKPKEKAKEKAKPTPKPKQAFKFEPKPDVVAIRTLAVPSPTEPATPSLGLQSKEPVSQPDTAPRAVGPLAAALPGTQRGQTKAIYQGKLLTWIAEHKRYPRLARRKGLEGVVEVTFRLDLTGRVQQSAVSGSSGYAILDQAVMRLLEQASPMPTPPDSFGPDELTFRVPVAFSLH